MAYPSITLNTPANSADVRSEICSKKYSILVSYFIFSQAYAPELFILDAHADNLRDSPSTIYPQSLNEQSLTRTASKTDSGYSRDRKPDRGGGSYKYPSYNYDAAAPIPGGHTPRRDPSYPGKPGLLACTYVHVFFYFNVVIGSCFESTTQVLSFLNRYTHVVEYLSLLVLMQG